MYYLVQVFGLSSVVFELTDAQAKAYLIADNRLAENSEWDERLLAEQLKQLSELNLDFALDVTGFEIAEIDLRIEELSTIGDRDEARADAVPGALTGKPVTRPGDMWILNDHRVLCGSALEQNSYVALMKGQKAQMVFTDPPYNVAIDGNATGSGKTHHREFSMARGEMSEQQFTRFLTTACSLLANNTSTGSLHFVCIDWRHLGELLAAGRKAYGDLFNLCVWVKNNGGLGSFYRSQHELGLVFKSGAGSHRNNVQLGQFGRNRTNVWHYQSATSSVSERYRFRLYSIPRSSTLTSCVTPCHSRIKTVPAGAAGAGSGLSGRPDRASLARRIRSRRVEGLSPPETCSWMRYATARISSSGLMRCGGWEP